MTKFKLKIPGQIKTDLDYISTILEKKGFECYMVGGSVRDLLLGIDSFDYDFATNARPEQIMKLFPRVAPTGIKHGTVTILTSSGEYEVTTFRSDGDYSDGRHPDKVYFSDTLEEDVKRRDFSINGLAYDFKNDKIIDLVGGLTDLENKIIRTIGDPVERFSEDGLRTLRACRFSSKLSELGFTIDDATFSAISKTIEIVKKVSPERIRDELMKILQTKIPSVGIECMRKCGLLNLILPELDAAYGVDQNKYHMYDVYWHSLLTCDAAPIEIPLIRFTALLHDIGKVPSRATGSDGDFTFYNHEIIGTRMLKKIMKRLKFSNEDIERVCNLSINHMFHYKDEWTDGAVRRFMRKVGIENIDELFRLRMADRQGNGSREGLPAPILKLQERIKKIISEENAITVKDLDINGRILMEQFTLTPGPIIGRILNELLEIILDEPEKNNKEILLEMSHRIIDNIRNEKDTD
jgi:poly(A) polymerase/tRNA nucleotidyltransferase (CCA-adding enzyme)